MTLYGYTRVSTGDRDLSIQEASLRAAGCQVIRSDKKTGTQREGRTELDVLLQFLRPGDTLVVTRIDRLARSLKDLQDIVHELKAKGVTLRATDLARERASAFLAPSTAALEDALGDYDDETLETVGSILRRFAAILPGVDAQDGPTS